MESVSDPELPAGEPRPKFFNLLLCLCVTEMAMWLFFTILSNAIYP